MADELAQNAYMFQATQKLGQKAWKAILGVLTPAACLNCKAQLSEPTCLCIECWPKLAQLDDPVCDMLGLPFAYDQGAGARSPEALSNPPAWNRARAAVIFDDLSREIIHAFKYNDHAEAGELMARQMNRAGRALIAEADLIIPVPLHWSRLWKRRFNQAAFLAQKIAKANDKIYAPFLLKRIRATKPQVGLSAQDRSKNLRKAFAVSDHEVLAGKNILLIDDVRTSGATLKTCTEVLREAGAAQVNVLTFALVNKPFAPHI